MKAQPPKPPTAAQPQERASDTKALLDRIRSEVAQLSPEEVKKQLEQLKARAVKQREYRTGKELTPEQQEKRKAYNRERMARPEVREKMKAYRDRPEVKAKQKAYRQRKAAREKLLLERARQEGLDVD